MATIQFNSALFRALFPVYANTVEVPDIVLQSQWDAATGYITNNTITASYLRMNTGQQTQALNLMTAHLMALNQLAATGQQGGLLQGATIDKVSVTLTPPPEANQWQWWLNQTPYGQQLLSLLQVVSAGGFFFTAGAPVVGAFRRR